MKTVFSMRAMLWRASRYQTLSGTLDLALARLIPLARQLKLNFRAEVFNVFNTRIMPTPMA
jgi:hypothetical protein